MDLYRRLRTLDHQTVGTGLSSIPTGRAYTNGSLLYADKIHVFPFGENLKTLQVCRSYPHNQSASLYMGTAGLMNLGHLCRIRPSHAVLFDVNPFQTIFWNVIVFAMKQNVAYEDFKRTLNYSEIITGRIISQKLQAIEFSAFGSMTSMLHGGDPQSLSRHTFPRYSQLFSSYLDEMRFSDEHYHFIRNMAIEGRIGTLTLDMFDVKAWQQFSTVLNEIRDIDPSFPKTVGSLYVSSAFRFVKADTDWTGRKLKQTSAQGVFSVLDGQKSVVMDSTGVYSVPEFQAGMMKDERLKSCLQPAIIREFAQERGGVRSAQPSALSLTA